MTRELYDKISDLLLFAVNFQEGDKITLAAEIDQRPVILNLVETAYKRGAAFVDVDYRDPVLQALAIQGAQKSFWFPGYLQEKFREITQKGWKLIGVYSETSADVFNGLDGLRSSRYFQDLAKVVALRMKAVMSNQIPWTLTYLPSEAMAKKAFPNLSAEKALQAYWELVIKIMRLDEDDPVAFWKKKAENDAIRVAYMDSLQPEYLHFQGPGTDLKVGLAEKAQWVGGFDTCPDGTRFMANIPTDEIFTSPDWRKTDGRVTLTKPFVMHQNLGAVPQKAWFVFHEGRVVDYGAEEGKESLDNLFRRDDRARYIGEVALVDPQSPFASPGITFYNGLYDENAACHIALGKAYPATLKERKDYTDEELRDLGLNTSDIHEDMMIGGEQVDVTAYSRDGKKQDIIRDGRFVI
ncbi:MAG: aminopeptidase [Spirochaetales bacterium]|nr:aminopeptidase [Spirochaetales bacterium]